MPDDWDWFWASESGRDSLLRNEVEGLHAQASQARSQAARLSSQLAKVQGSLETRLSALAAAFDAYVELGDVREQLAGHPDTSAVRRGARAALEVLTRGGVPERLTGAARDYWLADGVNAVVARVSGTPDPETEARAVALDRDAELFVVAALGALGRGAQVGQRVPPLLVTDGELSPAQQALWTAVLAGEYGDVLPAVHEPWRPALHDPDAGWRGWARTEARSSTPLETLRWAERQVAASQPGATYADTSASPTGRSAADLVPADDLVLARPGTDPTAPTGATTAARSALAAVALALIDRGLGEEVALLERARELRARIESPGGPPVSRDRPRDASAPTTVLIAARSAFLTAAPGSAARAELLSWVSSGLGVVVDSCIAELEAARPESQEARTPGGLVQVAPPGVTAEQRARAESRVHEQHAAPPASARLVPAVAAGVLLVGAVLLGAFGNGGLATLAGLATVVALGLLVRGVFRERSRRQDLKSDLEVTSRYLDDTEARVRQQETSRLDAVAEAQRLASGLRERLGATVR